MNNLAHEFAECAAYYSISSKIIEPQNSIAAEQLDQAALLAFAGSSEISGDAVTEARVEMAAKSLKKELGNDVANFSILLNKYSDLCGEALKHPEARMNYWLKKDQ